MDMLFLKEFADRTSSILSNPVLRLGESEISLYDIGQIIISLLLVIFIARALKNFLKGRLLSKLGIDEGNRESISTLVSYSFGTLGFIMVLQATGFDLTSLAVLAGGLGVGIGFGLQNLTKNFISGLTILVEGTVKAGDYVDFEGLSGFIKSISLRSTILRTFDGGYVIVPNSHMVENPIVNWSYAAFKDVRRRVKIPIAVSYDSDPLVVTEALLNSAHQEPGVIYEPSPRVMFREFGRDAMIFELWVWIVDVDSRLSITSSLNFIVEYNLRQQGIRIPKPQTDLWVRNPEELVSVGGNGKENGQELSQVASERLASQALKPISISDLLREVVYFKNFNDIQMRQLIENGHRQRLREAEVLFNEDDPGDAFYVVLSGQVEVYVEKIDKHLVNLGPGKFLGELALMLGIPRTASVRALTETVLFVLSKNGFEKLLREYPDIYEAIVEELAKHQEELTQRQQQLREMGLVDELEDDSNPVDWVRKRLKNLFSL
ncbi:MAG: mechanosensitive ion channel [Oscillatoria sp. SIO1A7]|nr:mechanosensitive ion channel [Oscillatoria sp. SIO1A7]